MDMSDMFNEINNDDSLDNIYFDTEFFHFS